MVNIERFDDTGFMSGPNTEGEWVKYEDHKAEVEGLEAHIENINLGWDSLKDTNKDLKAEVERLQKKLELAEMCIWSGEMFSDYCDLALMLESEGQEEKS